MELLITSLIFVIVLVTFYTSFHTGMFGHRRIEAAIDSYQTARQILEQINLDLKNAFSFSQTETKFFGQNNQLEFLTLVNSYREEEIIPEYALVAYQLEEDKLMRLCRKNQESLNINSKIEPQELAANIASINFSYIYLDSQGQFLEKDSWATGEDPPDEQKRFPIAVKVKLTIKNKTREEFERQIFF